MSAGWLRLDGQRQCLHRPAEVTGGVGRPGGGGSHGLSLSAHVSVFVRSVRLQDSESGRPSPGYDAGPRGAEALGHRCGSGAGQNEQSAQARLHRLPQPPFPSYAQPAIRTPPEHQVSCSRRERLRQGEAASSRAASPPTTRTASPVTPALSAGAPRAACLSASLPTANTVTWTAIGGATCTSVIALGCAVDLKHSRRRWVRGVRVGVGVGVRGGSGGSRGRVRPGTGLDACLGGLCSRSAST